MMMTTREDEYNYGGVDAGEFTSLKQLQLPGFSPTLALLRLFILPGLVPGTINMLMRMKEMMAIMMMMAMMMMMIIDNDGDDDDDDY